jgi:hypothetical protein
MPLTKKGARVKKKFQEHYGPRGEEVFYKTEAAGKLPPGVVKGNHKKKKKKK